MVCFRGFLATRVRGLGVLGVCVWEGGGLGFRSLRLRAWGFRIGSKSRARQLEAQQIEQQQITFSFRTR